jgi:hypothetical protein
MARTTSDRSTAFTRIRDAVAALRVESAVLDGEAILLRSDNLSDSDGLRSRQGQSEAILVTYDVLEVGQDVRPESLEERRKRLAGLLSRKLRLASGSRVTNGLCGLAARHRWENSPVGCLIKINDSRTRLAQDAAGGGIAAFSQPPFQTTCPVVHSAGFFVSDSQSAAEVRDETDKGLLGAALSFEVEVLV